MTDEAAAALAAAESGSDISGPGRGLGQRASLARAWVAASQGAVTEAIKTVLSAAETAGANGQFAAEVMCLQTATQFGELPACTVCGSSKRLSKDLVVALAARFAAALHAGDGAELAAVSEEFEQMGDLVAALDAAAHAAMVYRRRDLRGSALGCSARAEALAEQCGGASTPALRQASERLPLTDREREIVMLLGAGVDQPAHCPAPDAIRAHRRRSYLPGDGQDRRAESRAARGLAARTHAETPRLDCVRVGGADNQR